VLGTVLALDVAATLACAAPPHPPRASAMSATTISRTPIDPPCSLPTADETVHPPSVPGRQRACFGSAGQRRMIVAMSTKSKPGLFETRPEVNRQMNKLICAGRDRGVSYGSLGATGRPTGQPSDAAERNARAVTDLEAAERSGDADAIAFAEHVLDQRIDEARASRGEAPRDEDRPRDALGRFTDTFDGGIQRRVRPGPQRLPQSSNDLFQQMISASRQERRESGAEQTVIAANT
jgi:hypothetical protein